MHNLILEIERDYKKPQVVLVKSGDTVKVHQRIKEAGKERLQVFEGLVIRVSRKKSLTYRILVRKITGAIGIEKSFLLHSPTIVKVEILKRAKVRRNYLSYMRSRIGKATRLKSLDFDRKLVNQGEKTDATVKVADTSSKIDKEVEEQDSPNKTENQEISPKPQIAKQKDSSGDNNSATEVADDASTAKESSPEASAGDSDKE
ncbi:MAG: 50S ribosomal protein L19 [Candidatus Saccharibacteria bacterium]|nr:50S ribosomal protein L19 [Candidatus Saccharibacteria bacterium]